MIIFFNIFQGWLKSDLYILWMKWASSWFVDPRILGPTANKRFSVRRADVVGDVGLSQKHIAILGYDAIGFTDIEIGGQEMSIDEGSEPQDNRWYENMLHKQPCDTVRSLWLWKPATLIYRTHRHWSSCLKTAENLPKQTEAIKSE